MGEVSVIVALGEILLSRWVVRIGEGWYYGGRYWVEVSGAMFFAGRVITGWMCVCH